MLIRLNRRVTFKNSHLHNEPIYRKDTDSQTQRTNSIQVVKGQEVRGGMEWEFGTSRWKLLYTERITN